MAAPGAAMLDAPSPESLFSYKGIMIRERSRVPIREDPGRILPGRNRRRRLATRLRRWLRLYHRRWREAVLSDPFYHG